MYICTAWEPGTQGSQKGTLDPRNWSYQWLWAPMWILGTKAQSSARLAAASALDHRTITATFTSILNIGCFSRTLFSSLYLAICRVFACMCVYKCTVHTKARHLVISGWKWNCDWLWATKREWNLSPLQEPTNVLNSLQPVEPFLMILLFFWFEFFFVLFLLFVALFLFPSF